MRRNSVIVLFLAIVMGGLAAMLARNWLQNHARADVGDESIGTIVVAAQPLGFGAVVTFTGVPLPVRYRPGKRSDSSTNTPRTHCSFDQSKAAA